jgi:hypothetical protein
MQRNMRVVIAAAFSAAAMKRGPGAGKTWAGQENSFKIVIKA